jgi:hypothetical protein
MGIDDKRDGAMNAFSFLFGYLNMVAREIGMEQATALSSDVDAAMGAEQGKMIREKAIAAEFDARAAALIAQNSIEEGFGITSEVLEDSPRKTVFKVGRCPVFEAAQKMGLDAETIKTLCHAGPLKYMDALIKQLNPDLRYQLLKFRSTADDFCEEGIILG